MFRTPGQMPHSGEQGGQSIVKRSFAGYSSVGRKALQMIFLPSGMHLPLQDGAFFFGGQAPLGLPSPDTMSVELSRLFSRPGGSWVTRRSEASLAAWKTPPSDRVRTGGPASEMSEAEKSFLDFLKSGLGSSEPSRHLPYTPVPDGTPSFMHRRQFTWPSCSCS